MITKIVLWYLKRLLKQTNFEEECIEIHQETIQDADRVWQYYRKNKEALKTVVEYVEYLNR
jgi:hypothetical protein